jgi:tRNA G18 (ribose-2'-O)-methylase SpoU
MNVSQEERRLVKRNPIYIILDNVLDTYNIGAIFRLADGVAAEKVIITGDAEVPPNHRIKKASINTTEWVPWSYSDSAIQAINDLRSEVKGLRIIAVEQNAESIPYAEADYSLPLALVVGHETDGVSQDVLDLCDEIVEIPMWGVNRSLNVMVSLGIVLFEAMKGK